MKAIEIGHAFEEIAPIEIGLQSDRDSRVLGFRFGNSDIDVKGVGVAWYLSMEVINEAIQKGLNLLIIHEPHLFYNNNSPWYTCLLEETNPVNLQKKKLLIEHDICVYTAHSNWDLQQTVGMQPTFAKALGFTDEIRRDKAVGVYSIDKSTFAELTSIVKRKTGLQQLRLQGDPKQIVETVVVGFGGMGFAVDTILANNADAGIFGELGEFSFISARESGVGLIETTHLVSESIGFRSVVEVMQEKIPGMRIDFLEVSFAYQWA